MLFRSCAGGVVFYLDMVYLLRNEKNEWVLPKGVIRSGKNAKDVAKERVYIEAGIKAEILCSAGETCYEFYSLTRKTPVCNEIYWYVMAAESAAHQASREQGFMEGRYFPVQEGIDVVTYSQDKALIRLAYEKYQTIHRK